MGTAVAKRTATAVKLKPIADVVRHIKTHIYDANNAEARCVKHRLQAGQLLLQLRLRSMCCSHHSHQLMPLPASPDSILFPGVGAAVARLAAGA